MEVDGAGAGGRGGGYEKPNEWFVQDTDPTKEAMDIDIDATNRADEYGGALGPVVGKKADRVLPVSSSSSSASSSSA